MFPRAHTLCFEWLVRLCELVAVRPGNPVWWGCAVCRAKGCQLPAYNAAHHRVSLDLVRDADHRLADTR